MPKELSHHPRCVEGAGGGISSSDRQAQSMETTPCRGMDKMFFVETEIS